MRRTLSTKRHEALRNLLVEERVNSGLTQTQLAKRLHRHQSFISYLESGQRRIDVVEFVAIAEALGFDPCELIKRLMVVPREVNRK